MAYTVLARRYRSNTFDEVVGQNHIAQTLKKAIQSGRIAPCVSLLRYTRHRKDIHRPHSSEMPELPVGGSCGDRALQQMRQLQVDCQGG